MAQAFGYAGDGTRRLQQQSSTRSLVEFAPCVSGQVSLGSIDFTISLSEVFAGCWLALISFHGVVLSNEIPLMAAEGPKTVIGKTSERRSMHFLFGQNALLNAT